MCDCLKRIETMVSTRLSACVPHDAKISEGFDTGWDGCALSFTTGKMRVLMKYKMAYRAKKKNGEMAKNLTRLECSVQMSHCPFCGEKYDEDASADKGGGA